MDRNFDLNLLKFSMRKRFGGLKGVQFKFIVDRGSPKNKRGRP